MGYKLEYDLKACTLNVECFSEFKVRVCLRKDLLLKLKQTERVLSNETYVGKDELLEIGCIIGYTHNADNADKSFRCK